MKETELDKREEKEEKEEKEELIGPGSIASSKRAVRSCAVVLP